MQAPRAQYGLRLTMRDLARFLVLLLSLLSWSSMAGETAPQVPVPAFSLQGPEGQDVRFPDPDKTAPAVVFFFATWCPFCRKLSPHLAAVARDYTACGIDFYAINVWDDEGDPEAYLAGYNFPATLALKGEQLAVSWGVYGTPGLFVFNRNHEIVYRRSANAKPEDVAQMIREVLDRELACAKQSCAH